MEVEIANALLAILGVFAIFSNIAATLSQQGGLKLSGSSVVVVDVTVSWTGIDEDFFNVNLD